jgi:uncharacterized protein with FMN-binding domain
VAAPVPLDRDDWRRSGAVAVVVIVVAVLASWLANLPKGAGAGFTPVGQLAGVPTIAISAAGLTWLLHAQGVIDTNAVHQSAATPTSAPPADPGQPSTASPRTSPPTTRAPSSSGQTVDGPVVDTRYGPVQVEVVMQGGRITSVKALEYPTEARRSQSISQQALPLLREEVLSAQSANIDTISGATYTSDGYAQSLQAALDRVGVSTNQ